MAEILEHSVYVHLVGVGLIFAALYLLGRFDIDSHLSELPGKGPDDFLDAHFVEGTLLFTLYPVYVVFGAILMGAYDLPSWTTNRIVSGATGLTQWLSSKPLLGWVPSPHPAYPHEPIWYYAFHTATNGFSTGRPFLLIKMKQGDVYFGELVSYPVLPDEQKEKDFLIRRARFYPGGDMTQEYRLEEQDTVGAVLLNTADVDSIQIHYEWFNEQSSQ